jgi:ADP-ribose pyrophosphatase YjhB (NUDIX family)
MKHKSVGAIIKIKGKYLLLDRAVFPFGWAGPAGHVRRGETPEDALKREILAEANLEIKEFKLIAHEFIEWNECRKGVKGHDWYLYEVNAWQGEFVCNKEAKSMRCCDENEIMELELEPVWNYWFSKLGIIK